MDRDLSIGSCYPPFEQLATDRQTYFFGVILPQLKNLLFCYPKLNQPKVNSTIHTGWSCNLISEECWVNHYQSVNQLTRKPTVTLNPLILKKKNEKKNESFSYTSCYFKSVIVIIQIRDVIYSTFPLTLQTVDEIVWCDHSNETPSSVITLKWQFLQEFSFFCSLVKGLLKWLVYFLIDWQTKNRTINLFSPFWYISHLKG